MQSVQNQHLIIGMAHPRRYMPHSHKVGTLYYLTIGAHLRIEMILAQPHHCKLFISLFCNKFRLSKSYSLRLGYYTVFMFYLSNNYASRILHEVFPKTMENREAEACPHYFCVPYACSLSSFSSIVLLCRAATPFSNSG